MLSLRNINIIDGYPVLGDKSDIIVITLVGQDVGESSMSFYLKTVNDFNERLMVLY